MLHVTKKDGKGACTAACQRYIRIGGHDELGNEVDDMNTAIRNWV
jgi:hypothetical protein